MLTVVGNFFKALFSVPFFQEAIKFFLRPVASLLGLVLGWKFLEGEVNDLLSPGKKELSEDEAKKLAFTTLGFVIGLFLAGWLLGAGAKGQLPSFIKASSGRGRGRRK